MTMSGWADADRQPWVYGHPYTDINRKFLKLKMRLNPYAYTYCHEAHTTGVPMARAMVLNSRMTWLPVIRLPNINL